MIVSYKNSPELVLQIWRRRWMEKVAEKVIEFRHK